MASKDVIPVRVIRTKSKTYILPNDGSGQPIEQHFGPGVNIPDGLKDACVFQTKDGPIIVCQAAESEED